MKFHHEFQLKNNCGTYAEYEADGVTMRLDFFEHILRVSLIRDTDSLLPTWSVDPDGSCPQSGRNKLSQKGFVTLSPVLQEEDGVVSFDLYGLHFRIELLNFRITAANEKGILYQDRNSQAYNFDGELGDGSVHFTRREPDQKIYGLGDKSGHVNKNGRSFELGTDDAMGFRAEYSDPLYKHFPFYICVNHAGSYGLYYDTYSSGRVNFGEEHDNYFEPFNSIRYEEENMVFYLITGSPAEIIQRFNTMTGGIAPVPEWAFSYCGSTMEYTDARNADEQLRGFVQKCEENGIKARGFYLSSGYTQIGDQRCVFHWNTDKVPSPEGLAEYFRSHGLQIMPNIKPAFLSIHPLYQKIAENGWFLHYKDGSPAVFPFWGGMASYLDFTNPGAYAFWQECVRDSLIRYGYQNLWNDNNEYDVWDKDVYACGFGREVQARLIRPLFSCLMAGAGREICLKEAEYHGTDPFMISRCAIPGTQRIATTWTGDNYTDFRDLRFNHYQAMTMSLSGFAFFGQDIGGFSGPKPGKELFLRWLQYALFTPRFVLHSWKPGEPSTMPWLYEDLMDHVRKLFALRETLVPYLHAQMQRCVSENLPLIYPVFLKDPEYDPEADCFMCGDSILACPVFDEGKESVHVQLPSFSAWKLRGEGETIKGGTELEVSCTPFDLPVWFVKA
ncbi:MAG: hypothetical protein K6A40_12425 [Solobacterium sp.]|nr:hypothetical protein [Solobacterium sp.]